MGLLVAVDILHRLNRLKTYEFIGKSVMMLKIVGNRIAFEPDERKLYELIWFSIASRGAGFLPPDYIRLFRAPQNNDHPGDSPIPQSMSISDEFWRGWVLERTTSEPSGSRLEATVEKKACNFVAFPFAWQISFSFGPIYFEPGPLGQFT